MRNLVRTDVVEVKASLNADAQDAIKDELDTISNSVRVDVISSTTTRLFDIINTCVNAAYQLGKIDGKKGEYVQTDM